MAHKGGSLKSTFMNGVKVYSFESQNPSPATWLNQTKLRALRKDKDYMRRVELIQDLRFEAATSRIKATPDGEYLIASGTYPPQVKVYELQELSLKFKRHLVSEIINFQIFEDDYSKIAFLCADRSICLHAKYGSHYSFRIPRMGRDLVYDPCSCDLICAASSPDLYRFNLNLGRFLPSLETQSPASNVVSRSKVHGLVGCGGEDGAVECFDMRVRSSIGRINIVASPCDISQEVSALEFDGHGGYHMAVGTRTGKVLIYDLRSSHPILVKDHMYDSPILNIKWHQTINSDGPKLITADKHIVRIWDPDTGKGMTSIEPTAGPINDFCVFNESGLLFLALDTCEIPPYFIPALGPAPKWCSYLENLTEEMEEGAQTIYDDFKFLTKEDIERLNLTNLIGTNLLRAYMHGFFIDYRLYKKAHALINPFAYDAYIEQRKKEKQEAERSLRITAKRRLPKVNRVLAARLLDNEEAQNKDNADGTDIKKSKGKKGLSSEVFKDERFAAMFQNKNFEVDENSMEYMSLHPVASTKNQSSLLLEEHFEPVMEDEGQSSSDSDIEAPQSSEDEHAIGGGRNNKKLPRATRMYEVKDERHAEAFRKHVSIAKEDSLSFGDRLAALTNKEQVLGSSNDVKVGLGGSREISFISKSSAKYKEDDEDMDEHPHKRRGIQSLKLKPDNKSGYHGRGRGGGRGRGARGKGRGRGRGRR